MATFFTDNQFSFTCPIFNVDTKASACAKLRELRWRGERVQVRKGCQAAMTGGKCPVAAIITRMGNERGYRAEEYTSDTPVKGKLCAPVLERIQPVIVTERTLIDYSVPLAERDLIASAGTRITEQLAKAPASEKKRISMQGSGGKAPPSRKLKGTKSDTPAPVAPAARTAAQNAAASGDLSAAINGGEA